MYVVNHDMRCSIGVVESKLMEGKMNIDTHLASKLMMKGQGVCISIAAKIETLTTDIDTVAQTFFRVGV